MENRKEIIAENKNEVPVIKKKIGQTTFLIGVHFSETGKETMEDKIFRLVRDDIRYRSGDTDFVEKQGDMSYNLL